MKDELGRIWKEAVVAQLKYTFLKGLTKPSLNSPWADSIGAPPEFESSYRYANLLSEFAFIVYTFRQILLRASIQGMRLTRHVAHMRYMRNAYETLIGKFEAKTPRIPKCRWDDSFKVDIVAYRPVDRQRPERQCTGWKEAFSAPIAAHVTMDTATEEQCFLCGPCRGFISGKKSSD
jgi:hypothetical protein